MDENDTINPRDEVLGSDEEKWPAGLLANQAAGAGTASGTAGPAAAGPIAGAAASRLVGDQEPADDNSGMGTMWDQNDRQMGDDGVSRAQKEAEADELNG